MRIGKAVTQEEVAEAVGITRQWYSLLEGNAPVRVSPSVLARVADALMMDFAERMALFRLVLPEIHATSLTKGSVLLDAFASLRHLTRRLWAATTEAEALTVVREYAITELAADAMVTFTRVCEGGWDRVATGNLDDERDKELHATIRERCGDNIMDDLLCYALMEQPGELITRLERDACFPDLAAKDRPAFDAVGLGDISFAMAHVQTSHGFVARILAHHAMAHEYSEIERAHLSMLADLTSLALSGT